MEIKLSLTLDTVNACLTALGKLPFEFAAQHINILQAQAGPQVEAAQKRESSTEENVGLTD
jgi:hypothetical protein